MRPWRFRHYTAHRSPKRHRSAENPMPDSQDRSLRKHVLDLLDGGNAHAKFDDVVPGIPAKLRGRKPEGLPHSPWMLLEHMRIAQRDILEFSRSRKHVSPKWPDGYWP